MRRWEFWHRDRTRVSYQQFRSTKTNVLLTAIGGLRRGEATRLTWADSDLKSKILTVHDTKSRDLHTLALGKYLHELLARRHKMTATTTPNAPVFDIAEPKKLVAKIFESSGV